MTNPEEINTIKDLVLKVVKEKPFTRESYKALIFEVWIEQSHCKISKRKGYYIPMPGDHYKNLANPNTIGRCYRMIKKEHPELRPSAEVEEWRREREAQMRDINIHWQPQGITTRKQTLLFGD